MKDKESRYYFQDDDGNVWSTFTTSGDIARGRCSGIPECCIKYFTNAWKKALKKEQNLVLSLDWGYIPCRACRMSGNKVKVKHCWDKHGADCTCGAWANRQLEFEPYKP